MESGGSVCGVGGRYELLFEASEVSLDLGDVCGLKCGETELLTNQVWSHGSSAWCLCRVPA